jgi:hypothetical protein
MYVLTAVSKGVWFGMAGGSVVGSRDPIYRRVLSHVHIHHVVVVHTHQAHTPSILLTHKIIKRRTVSKGIGIENLAHFLSISPNQTQVFAVWLPGPKAGLFCHSCFNLCSVFRKAINLYTS